MNDNNLEELYKKYPSIDNILSFYDNWESIVTYLLYDAGATKYDPAKFGIERVK